MNQISVEYIDHLGDDRRCTNAARVTFDNWKTDWDDKDARLVRYLYDHKHGSPGRHIVVTVRCIAPIFLSRQLQKHVVGMNSWNEVSRRYVDTTPEFYWPAEWRMRPAGKIKQGSGEAANDSQARWANDDYADALSACRYAYESMLDRGIAPELARMVLPQSMMTSWLWTGSLPAFFHLWRLRIDSHAQREAQLFAEQVEQAVSHVAPHCWAAMKEAAA